MKVNEETLARVAHEVLGTMAFAFVTPDAAEFQPGQETLAARVRFSGPFSGSVVLRVPKQVLPELAGNMLAKDEGDACTQQEQHDALGELANMMCGNLVAEEAGPGPVFDLEAPEVAVCADPPGSGAPEDRCASMRLGLENGWVELTMVLDP